MWHLEAILLLYHCMVNRDVEEVLKVRSFVYLAIKSKEKKMKKEIQLSLRYNINF